MADVIRVVYAPTEEQQMLRETTRRFLEDKAPSAVVRELMGSESGFDEKLWRAGAELGWHSLAIPEEYGGAGYTFAELAIVLEELGRAAVPMPFLSTVVMAASAIAMAGSDSQKAELLPGIAAGESVMTIALFEGPVGRSSADVTMAATATDGGWVLGGTKTNVLDGHVADILLVAARTQGGLSLFLVPAGTPGVTVTPITTLDATQKQATVTFADVELGEDALLGAEGIAAPIIDAVLQLTTVAVALEQVGGAEWCLETSVEHGKTRYQFGRAIGSFQAIKHRCADMLVAVEHAKSTAYHAARVVEFPDEFAIAAPLAGTICSTAFLQAAGDTIQILGGTGFTWEHDAHIYFKRAKSTALMFGGVRHQRNLLATAIGL